MTPGSATSKPDTAGNPMGRHRDGRGRPGFLASMALLVAGGVFTLPVAHARDTQTLPASACKPYSQQPPEFGLLRIRPHGIYNGHNAPKYVICPVPILPGTSVLSVRFEASNTDFGDNDIPLGPRQSCTLTVFDDESTHHTVTDIDYCCDDDSPWTSMNLPVSGSGNAVLTCKIQPRSRMLYIYFRSNE